MYFCEEEILVTLVSVLSLLPLSKMYSHADSLSKKGLVVAFSKALQYQAVSSCGLSKGPLVHWTAH